MDPVTRYTQLAMNTDRNDECPASDPPDDVAEVRVQVRRSLRVLSADLIDVDSFLTERRQEDGEDADPPALPSS